MNKNNRKKKGLSKRVLALMLCCFCLMATIPISAFALETGETQITEESISEQQSESVSKSLLSLSSETSESQTEADTQQSTSDEIIEPIIESETTTEVEIEAATETGTEVNTETETDSAGNETETGSEAEVNDETEAGAETETELEADGETESETGGEITSDESEISDVQGYTDALNLISMKIESLESSSENYDAEYEAIIVELELLELKISSAYDAGEITYEEFDALSVQLNDVLDRLFVNVEPEDDASTLEGENVDPDANYILVGKTFAGITADQIPEDFTITVNRGSEETHVLSLNSATPSEDGLTYRWRIDNVGAGTYTVTESNAAIDKYDLAASGTGTVEVKVADFAVTYVKETTCNHRDWPVKIDGDQNVLFAAALTTGGCVVISKEPLTATQRLTVANQVTSLGGNWKEPVNFYSIAVNGNGPWSINDKSLEYHPDEGKIWLSRTSDWSHVATLQYSITEASNPDINIINTYTPKVCNLTISKTVSGNMGDQSKEFAFTAALSGEGYSFDGVTYSIDGGEAQSAGTGTECTFNLKHGQTVTFTGLPIGAIFTVTETSYSGYVTTVDGVTGNSKEITLAETNNNIAFVNTKDVTIDTGILLDTLPYILILGVVAVGAVLLIKKRRNRDDD